MVKHYLKFHTLNETEPREIEEWWGSDGVGFSIKEDTGRLGIDSNFSGNGEAQYTAHKSRNHQFERLDLCYLTKGYEAKVEYLIDFGNGLEVVGDVDFYTYKTNMVDKASFTVIQSSNQQTFKRRQDTSVNAFSAKDINGNPITPPKLYDILLKAPSVNYVSKWITSSVDKYINLAGNYPYMGIARAQTEYDVPGSVTPFFPTAVSEPAAINNFVYLIASDNLTNLQLQIDLDVLFDYRQQGGNSSTKASIELKYLAYTGDYPSGELIGGDTLYYKEITGTTFQTFQLPSTINAVLPNLPRGTKLAIYWKYFWVTATAGGATINNRTRWNMNDVKYTISAAATSYSTIIKGFRYRDIIKYVTKSVSGLDVDIPQWELGGEFYNLFLTNPSLIRRITDKFNISLKSIFEKSIRPAFNGDYQIRTNDTVFVGTYDQLYRDFLCGEFAQMQFNDFENSIGEGGINLLNIEFDNYASLKENESQGTAQTIHAEAQYIVNNTNVENSQDIKIGWGMDGILFRDYQLKVFELSTDTVGQDDDKILMLDCVVKSAPITFTDTSQLRHQQDIEVNNKLIITIATDEGQTFDWRVLGIEETANFTILSGANAGTYTILEISGLSMTLQRNASTPVTNITSENTQYSYVVGNSIQVMNRTNEGLTTENIQNPERGVNLAWSVRQIIERFYKVSLGSEVFFLPSFRKLMQNSIYKNNGAATINGIREDSPISPSTPILTPYRRDLTVLSTLTKYWNMQQALRNNNGFVRCYDPTGWPVDLFLSEANWTVVAKGRQKGKIELKGVEMYRQFLVTILADSTGTIFNGTIRPAGFRFSTNAFGYVSFFDATGKRLLPPVRFDRVSVNGSGAAPSVTQLGLWLAQWSI